MLAPKATPAFGHDCHRVGAPRAEDHSIISVPIRDLVCELHAGSDVPS